MTAAHVAHDPFTRGSLHRETSAKPCAWCGQLANWPTRMHYTYRGESDAEGCRAPVGRVVAFCNLDCLRAYTG